MKLFFGLLGLTFLMAACGGSNSGSGGKDTQKLNGNYVSFTEKGHTVDGVEVKEDGDLLELVKIRDGKFEMYYMDLSDKTYKKMQANVSLSGDQLKSSVISFSCPGDLAEDVDESPAATVSVSEKSIKIVDKFDGEASTEELVRISDEELSKIEAILATFTEANSEVCEKRVSVLDKVISVEETKAKLDELLK